jgi:hypothetical protein
LLICCAKPLALLSRIPLPASFSAMTHIDAGEFRPPVRTNERETELIREKMAPQGGRHIRSVRRCVLKSATRKSCLIWQMTAHIRAAGAFPISSEGNSPRSP